jgi:RNA polymerase subunit RPABC4/transcription elongation factor Spt4
MEGTVARTLQVLIALCGAYFAALWVVLIVWTYRDIESRSRSVVTQAFSTMLSAFFFVPGVLLYMVLRPKETLDATFARSLEEEYLLQDIETKLACPNCHKSISEEYVVCPHCHTTLQQPCVNCGRTFDVSWSVCPYCAHNKSALAPSIRPVIQPLDRFVQSGPRSTIEELPAARMIEELESQAFYRLDTVPQATAIPANSGRPFDRRKTREMHRARQMNGRVAERVTSNGSSPNGHEANGTGNDDSDD